MTQWNKQRCGGEPLGGKRSGACCCSYCEGYADAIDDIRPALRNMIELAMAGTATACDYDAARKLLADEETS